MEDLFELKHIYSITEPPGCKGCSILGKPKPEYCIAEHELKEHSILFLSDSFKVISGRFLPFRFEETDLIMELLNRIYPRSNILDKCEFSASVKCPSVREADMNKDDKNICRKHLFKTIDQVQPKVIFACGNLPLVMLTKKSGINSKRGSHIELELESGFKCVVVPIFHPWQVIAEPKNRYLFELDIKNAIDQIIYKKVSKEKFEYEFIDSIEKMRKYDFLELTHYDLGIDTETTGLDFRRNKLNTVAISWKDKYGDYTNIVFPIYHKDNPVPELVKYFLLFIRNILKNPNNKKAFFNGKFDLRFFMMAGITEFVNVWDAKFLMHLYDENLPKSLKDCVGYFFPSEIGLVQKNEEITDEKE